MTHLLRSPRMRAVVACTICLALTQSPASAVQGGLSLQPTVVEAADANGDGDVSRAEWRAFTEPALASAEDARSALQVRVLLAWLDLDSDGVTTVEELSGLVGLLDADGNGVLDSGEMGGRAGAARRAQAPFEATMALGILLEAADVNSDGSVQAGEREIMLRAAGTSLEGLLADSVQRVTATGVGDRTALTPAVILLTLGSALDADRNRVVDAADVARLFGDLDVDGNGVVTSAERAPGPPSAPSAPLVERPSPSAASEPLMPWQRNLDDALALSSSTGKPLLICVNMDGEAASDALARGRYRDPEFVELAAGFIPILVSPDRHSPFEHDDQGRRIPDPRFGRVVEGEHIDHEPLLFERYFAGTRVAPRHVGVSPSGEILFDLYLLGNLSEIDDALEAHGVRPSEPEQVEPFEDEPVAQTPAATERASRFDFGAPLTSPDAADRASVEATYAAAEWRLRFELAATALDSKRKTQHPEVLRLALRDTDARVRQQAVWTALRELERVPAALLPELVRVAREHPIQSGVLRASLARALREGPSAEATTRLTKLLAALEGAASTSAVIDAKAWRAVTSASTDAERPERPQSVDACAEELAAIEAAEDRGGDDPSLGARRLELLVHMAHLQLSAGRDPSIALEEARRLSETSSAGDVSGRAAAYAAWCCYQMGDLEAATTHALRAGPRLLAAGDVGTRHAADLLDVLAQVRTRATYAAMGAGEDIPPEWIADVLSAHMVLLAHPLGEEAQALRLLQFLEALGLHNEQGFVLIEIMQRYPLSADLHVWMRGTLARDRGASALSNGYESWLTSAARDETSARATALWFTGLAHLVAADRHAAMGAVDAALETYARCEERFLSAATTDADLADSAMHYVALARTGIARLQLMQGRLDGALAAAHAALEARPASASIATASGESANQVARRLAAALARAGRGEEAQALRDALRTRAAASTDSASGSGG